MEPDEGEDTERSTTPPIGWWRRQTYDYSTYYLDNDGMIQKIYHDPGGEELWALKVNTVTQREDGRRPPLQEEVSENPKILSRVLRSVSSLASMKDGDRGSTPVSFKPLARPTKFFVQGGARSSNVTNETFGPTKLEMTSFKSTDSEGHNAWHSSQSPNDLDVPLPDTPTPRMVGTTYVHRNTTDGGYQVWVWCSREGGELAWQPVDLNNEQVAHPKISNRSLKLTLSGKPSWVLNSTLSTYQKRNSSS
ncbi:hypothetical protein EV361DRAFT_873743 [Lentinula raphanica]|nr:hypothetical protein EV361DRAFT_873743 [Lentinula raphanica]